MNQISLLILSAPILIMRDLYFQFYLLLYHLESLYIFQKPMARGEVGGRKGEVDKGD